jgi:hypothetical protein
MDQRSGREVAQILKTFKNKLYQITGNPVLPVFLCTGLRIWFVISRKRILKNSRPALTKFPSVPTDYFFAVFKRGKNALF